MYTNQKKHSLYEVLARRCKPLLIMQGNELLIYSKGALYLLNNEKKNKEKLCTLPLTIIKRILCRWRLFERMLRLEPRGAKILDSQNIIFSFNGGMYRINIKDKCLILEHQYRMGINNPLNIGEIKGIDGFQDCIAYGEYCGNSHKNEINIFTRGFGINDQWELKYQFPKHTITHIHSIIPDPYRKSVLILTGDDDNESGIWMAKNDFQEVIPLFIGSQQYRSCCAYPIPEGIIYATDSPIENNFIYFLKYDGIEWSSEKLFELNGSCIYSTFWNNKFLFSTTVEPDSTIKGFKYLLTNKLGKGIKNREVHVISGDLYNGFHCILKFTKDIWPMTLFQFGSVQFCNSDNSEDNDILYLYPSSIKKYDGLLIGLKES